MIEGELKERCTSLFYFLQLRRRKEETTHHSAQQTEQIVTTGGEFGLTQHCTLTKAPMNFLLHMQCKAPGCISRESVCHVHQREIDHHTIKGYTWCVWMRAE